MVTQSQKHYKTTVSLELNNKAWDDFLLSIDHGHHVQSSLWAEVKTSQGWQAATVTLNEADQIVAGAQLLYKPLPVKWMGCIGYIPKGPVFQHYSFEQLSQIIGEIKHLLKKLRIRHLIVQPNRGSTSDFSEDLCKLGFVESGMIFSPVATVVIDLSLELDEIFSRMKPKTRYNINKAERQGVLAKEGTIENLNDFHLLLQSTAKRQKFIAESEAFFNKLWQVFKPKNYIKLFITQADSVDLSAVLLVAFGDTVIYKRGGWFGRKKI